MFALILVIVGSIVVRNFEIMRHATHLPEWNYVEWYGIFTVVPTVTYIYEVSSIILNIRRTMKEPQKLPKVATWTLSVLGFVIFLVGISYILAYGKDDSKRIAFEYYKNKDSVFFSF